MLATGLGATALLGRDSDKSLEKSVEFKSPKPVLKEPAPKPDEVAEVVEAESEDAVIISKQDDDKRIDAYRDQLVKDQEAERQKVIQERISKAVRERLATERESVRAQRSERLDRERREITELVTKGNKAIDEDRLVSPPAANAIYFFREALYIRRDDPSAHGGLDRVLDVLGQRVDKALSDGDIDSARTWAELVTMQRPDDDRLSVWRDRIRAAVAAREATLRETVAAQIQQTTDLSVAERSEAVNSAVDAIRGALDAGDPVTAQGALDTLKGLDPQSPAIRLVERALRLESSQTQKLNDVATREETSRVRIVELELQLEASQTQLQATQTQVEATRAELETARIQLADRASASDADNDLAQSARTAELDERDAQISAMTEEIVQLREQTERQDEQISAARVELDGERARSGELRQALEDARQQVASANNSARAASAPAPTLPAAQTTSQPTVARTVDESVLLDGIAAYYVGNYRRAFNTLYPLAQAGNARAQFRVAVMYFHGRGVDQSELEADRWMSVSADGVRSNANLGRAWAQADLGSMYERGWLLSQSYESAAQWYTLAVRQGYAPAQNNLGVLHEQGLGVAQDRDQAVTLLRLAAAQGDAIAKENLATLGF